VLSNIGQGDRWLSVGLAFVGGYCDAASFDKRHNSAHLFAVFSRIVGIAQGVPQPRCPEQRQPRNPLCRSLVHWNSGSITNEHGFNGNQPVADGSQKVIPRSHRFKQQLDNHGNRTPDWKVQRPPKRPLKPEFVGDMFIPEGDGDHDEICDRGGCRTACGRQALCGSFALP
jgi:hypothetical protein